MSDETQTQNQNKSSFWELVRYAILALVIVIPFRIFIAQPYIVEGSSMDPTFKTADYLVVDQISKRFEEPERQSVAIIKYPKDPSKFFIKRIIGLPGETVEIKNGKVFISNGQNTEAFGLEEPYVIYGKNENFTTSLDKDEYFVMGDNRAGSSDSRAWGPVPKKLIVGRPVVRILPITEMNLWPGI